MTPNEQPHKAGSLLAEALDLAGLGWHIFPLHHVEGDGCSCGELGCKSQGKHPRTANGLKDGTTETATIRDWWRHWPSANLGVRTGPESGVWMLGPDGPEGIEALAELVRKYAGLPRTPSAKSGSCGRHYYFRWPADGNLVNRRNHRGLPIDVRGEGGYFVAPPSRNRNGPYVWEVHPSVCQPADAPAWLLAWCRGESKQKADTFRVRAGGGTSLVDRAAAYLEKMPPAVSGQGGHDRTMEAARVVVYGFDLGPEVGFQLLWQHYNPRCDPPWSEKELRHKCAEANTVPFGKARGWLLAERLARVTAPPPGATAEGRPARIRTIAPYQPFPQEALPPVVRSYVRQGAVALGCDPAFVALPVLAVFASAIGNTRVIRLKRGWTEPAIVWTAIVGDSGTLKSPAYFLAVHRLFAVQKQLLAQHKRDCAAYLDVLADWKEKKKEHARWQKGGEQGEAPDDPGDEPEMPVLRRVIVSDTTIEKLGGILEDNPRGTLVARDELAGWIGSFTKYKGKQGGSDVPNWLELNRAGTVMIDRKTGDRRTLFIDRAAASVTGGIQPGVLVKALTADLLDSGLAARLLLCWPPSVPKRWSEAEVDPDIERAVFELLDNLLALDFDSDREGRPAPRVLRLAPEAKAAWVEWVNGWGEEQAAVEGELAAAFSKIEAYAARFALVYHVVGHAITRADDSAPVGLEAVEAGVTLARWFAGEVRRVYCTLGETAEERDTRRLVDFIRGKGGSITVRDLQNSNSGKYPDRGAAASALNRLADAGLGRWDDGPAPERGGHRPRWFLLHPTPDTSDTRSAGDAGGAEDLSDTRPDTNRGTPENHGGNGRVSEASGVGTGWGGSGPAPDGSGVNCECRARVSDGGSPAGDAVREPGAEG